jgi:hypothetical protein
MSMLPFGHSDTTVREYYNLSFHVLILVPNVVLC